MVRGFLFVLFVSVLFVGCGDELVSNFDHDVSTADRIAGRKWYLKSYVIKVGTHDPDEVVPDDQMGVIENGKYVKGAIILNTDSTVTVESGAGFVFNQFDELKWVVDSDSTIRFIRYDWQGKIEGSFLLHLRFPDSMSMQWYSKGIGIESGELSVIIISLYLK